MTQKNKLLRGEKKNQYLLPGRELCVIKCSNFNCNQIGCEYWALLISVALSLPSAYGIMSCVSSKSSLLPANKIGTSGQWREILKSEHMSHEEQVSHLWKKFRSGFVKCFWISCVIEKQEAISLGITQPLNTTTQVLTSTVGAGPNGQVRRNSVECWLNCEGNWAHMCIITCCVPQRNMNAFSV